MAISGMARNMPGIPQSAVLMSTKMIEISALIFILEATTFGIRK